MYGNLRNWNAGWLLAVFPKIYGEYNIGVSHTHTWGDHPQPTADTHVRCQHAGSRAKGTVLAWPEEPMYVGIREMMSLSHLC